VGPVLNRGELADEFGKLETPSFGLHEFLDLCEELNLVPVVGVNVLGDGASAADLVEYILGSSTSPQGTLRAANGRSAPWNVRFFELGNEPSARYAPADVPNAGSAYAAAARAVVNAMRARAVSLGKTIEVSALAEATYQLADWLPGNIAPDAQMLANWNSQVLQTGSSGLLDSTQFVHGHFYVYDDIYAAIDGGFPALMGAGELLHRLLATELPHDRPMWITEYQVSIKDPNNTQQIDPAYTLDYQSGLVVTDMLMTMVNDKVAGAHVFNLSARDAFGLLMSGADWRLRPAAHAFRLVAPFAGEERLPVTLTVTTPAAYNNTHALATGVGNLPTGLSYAKVTAVATRTAAGKPRVIVLNRDPDADVTLQLAVAGQTATATLTRYLHSTLLANNEAANVIDLTAPEIVAGTVPLGISVPRHSVVRVDFH
jgi:alpha-L-arabinofuranosidase